MAVYTAQGQVKPPSEEKPAEKPPYRVPLPAHLRRVRGGPGGHGSTYYGRLQRCAQLWSNHYNFPPEESPAPHQANRAQALGILSHAYYGHWNAERGARQPGGFLFRGEQVEGEHVFVKPADAVRLEAEEADAVAPTIEGQLWVDLVDDAIRAGRGYRQRFGREEGRIIGVEEQRPITIKSPFTGAAYEYDPRLDLEWEVTGEGVWLRDLKTTSYLWGDPEEDYSLDIQFIGMQVIGRRIYGRRFAGVSVEHVRIAPDRILVERYFPVPAPHALRDWELSRAEARDRVARLQRMGLRPDRYPKATTKDACGAWGGCEFRPRCQQGPDWNNDD